VLVTNGFIILYTQVYPLTSQRFRKNSDLVTGIPRVLTIEDHSRSAIRFLEEVWMNITVVKESQCADRSVGLTVP